MKTKKAQQNAQEFINKTGIGEPYSALSLDESYCAMWKKNNRMLKVTFYPSGLYSLSYRSNSTTLNYKGNLARPLGRTTLKAIQEVSENDLDFFTEPSLIHPVLYLNDTTEHEAGDIIQVRIGKDKVEFKKEGARELILSMDNFRKVQDRLELLQTPNTWGRRVKVTTCLQ